MTCSKILFVIVTNYLLLNNYYLRIRLTKCKKLEKNIISKNIIIHRFNLRKSREKVMLITEKNSMMVFIEYL